MKKAKVKTKDICEELNIPKNTFNDWVRAAKNAETWSDVPGEVSRPAPRKKWLSIVGRVNSALWVSLAFHHT